MPQTVTLLSGSLPRGEPAIRPKLALSIAEGSAFSAVQRRVTDPT